MDLDTLKTLTTIIHSVATVVALIVGGAWTYLLFVRQRERFPRAHLTHSLTHRPFLEGRTLLSVDITLCNEGKILLSVQSAEVRVKQVLPVPPSMNDSLAHLVNTTPRGALVGWPQIGYQLEQWDAWIEIEPGDWHALHYEFLLDAEVKAVLVDSYFKNSTKRDREIGWMLTTFYDLERNSGAPRGRRRSGQNRKVE